MLRQIEDRVTHQLSRAVIRDVAPTLRLEKLDPPRGKGRFRPQQMGALSAASKCDDRGMFEEQEQVPHPALDAKRRQTALELERLTVRGEAQVDAAAYFRHQFLYPKPPTLYPVLKMNRSTESSQGSLAHRLGASRVRA